MTETTPAAVVDNPAAAKSLFPPLTWPSVHFWAAGCHDLTYCIQRLYYAHGCDVEGDDLGVGINISAAIGKFWWYARHKISPLKDGYSVWKRARENHEWLALPTETIVVDVTMDLVAFAEFLNGYEVPADGIEFSLGISKFETVDADLELAMPDSLHWAGDVADAYAAKNAALQERVRKMEELDQRMQNLIASQAAQVKQAQLTIAEVLLSLIAAQGVALLLYASGVWGPTLSVIWQVATAVAAIGLVIAVETETAAKSEQHADDMSAVEAEYADLAAGTQQPTTGYRPAITAAQETRLDGYAGTAARMSGPSGVATVSSTMSPTAPRGTATPKRTLADDPIFLSGFSTVGAALAGIRAARTPGAPVATPAAAGPGRAATLTADREDATPEPSSPSTHRAPIEVTECDSAWLGEQSPLVRESC